MAATIDWPAMPALANGLSRHERIVCELEARRVDHADRRIYRTGPLFLYRLGAVHPDGPARTTTTCAGTCRTGCPWCRTDPSPRTGAGGRRCTGPHARGR